MTPDQLERWLHTQTKAVAYELVRDCDRGNVYDVEPGWSTWPKRDLIAWLFENLDPEDYPVVVS
ncbi:hypothetical protein SEA_SKOG_57 [Gordonia phage Skog]|uniref:Uncharacterized protein n=1 Tax=Gordonia phage Skog TaxID=2704033 RepID=A0A6G6XJB8_9CAUD|nr:hypothetical protein KHQ85_gp057 [Gordonia phage Skog]QIG58209.1 hypothetical protein SEA_SKOG_57 [Gordonia phage Skog]